jgi:hypothetical protein
LADFELQVEKRPKYLFVKGTGVRNGFKAVHDSSIVFANAVQENPARYILVDYSHVVTRVSATDVFNITRLYETGTSHLSKLCLSIVINPAEVESEKLWEEICGKRGFNFKIFLGIGEAEQWLLTQIETVGQSSRLTH